MRKAWKLSKKFILLPLGVLLLLFVAFGSYTIYLTHPVNDYKGPVTNHYDGKIFHNIGELNKKPRRKKLWTRLMGKKRAEWPRWISNDPGPAPTPPSGRRSVKYVVVNHSTILIQAMGLNILTDPIWSDRCSPYSWLGPHRVQAPGIRMEDLPPIDVVMISHNHYDHMDIPTLQKLEKKFKPLFVAGLGNKSFLKSEGLTHVEELDWWEKITVKSADIHFVPVRHWSNRSLFDRQRTLWGGYVIQLPQGSSTLPPYNIYFAGDTAFTHHFKETYDKFGPMHLSFLPIGAYEPYDFMKYHHMNPDDAVQAHKILRSNHSVGMHFGTFQLTYEAIDQPNKDLAAALRKHKVPLRDFSVPQFGEEVEIFKKPIQLSTK